MSRTLQNISRSLSSYGQESSRINRDALRSSNLFRQRAADARSRGVEQRGQILGNTLSGLGGMVGKELIQGPMRDLNRQRVEQRMEMGDQRMEVGKLRLADAKKAREDEEAYIDILSANRRNPSAIIEALHEAGMPERADDYYQGFLGNREFAAKAGKAETEEAAAKFRNLSELFVRFQENTPEEEWESAYPVVRRQAEEFLGGTAPELMEQLPETPDEATYQFMRNIGVRSRDFSDQLLAEENTVNLAKKKQDNRQDKMEGEDKNFIKGLQTLAKVRNQGGWEAQREFLLKNRIAEDQKERFNSLVPVEYSPEARDSLKDFLGDQKKLPADYQAARDTGFEGTYLEFVGEKADQARTEKEKKLPADYQAARDTGFEGTYLEFVGEKSRSSKERGTEITHSQASENLKSLASAVKERQYEEQFEGMNQEQITQAIANERKWDLEKFRKIAGGSNQQPPAQPIAPSAPPGGPAAETRELGDGTVWEKTSGGWKRIK